MTRLVRQDHPALHAIAAEVPVEEIGTPRIKKILKDMRAALESYSVEDMNGVAIAAPQIGVPLRIFIVHDTNQDRKEKRLPGLVAINPVLVKLSKEKHIVGEGCLSIEHDYGAVKRSVRATLRALDEEGREYERGASGLLAQIFQHEIDHLDGILFVDKAERVWNKDALEA